MFFICKYIFNSEKSVNRYVFFGKFMIVYWYIKLNIVESCI